jgi:DNA-binding NarL/FixJ family response regulator
LERSVSVLIVDDYAPFRQFLRSKLESLPYLQIIGEASDGLEAVRKARELHPDLILLDIGLPGPNGIQAARQMRELSPAPKILFVSENRSKEIAQEALRSGAHGYVLKSDAANELLPAVKSVIRGMPFVSASLAGRVVVNPETRAEDGRRRKVMARQHEVGFYSDEHALLEDVAAFIGTFLKAGNAAIVAATKSHLESLLPRLKAYDIDICSAIELGRYIFVDAADVLSMIMLNGMPDRARFMSAFSNLIQKAKGATGPDHSRVAIFGECANLLFAEGNIDAAFHVEELGNQLVDKYDVDILCGYSIHDSHPTMEDGVYYRICAEHSAVHAR